MLAYLAGISVFGAVGFYLMFVYIVSWLQFADGIAPAQALTINTLSMALLIPAEIGMAALSALKEHRRTDLCEGCRQTRLTDVALLIRALQELGGTHIVSDGNVITGGGVTAVPVRVEQLVEGAGAPVHDEHVPVRATLDRRVRTERVPEAVDRRTRRSSSEPAVGFEPTTCCLQDSCSTP